MFVTCPQCDATYQVADEFEGKTLKCADCQAGFRARISRAAIKTDSSSSQTSGTWPAKAPTLVPGKARPNETKHWIIFGSVVAAIVLGFLIAGFTYVYRVNNSDNITLDPEYRTKTSQEAN